MAQGTDITGFEQDTVSSTTIINFNLTYKGIEVEGTYTERMNHSAWIQEVVIEDNDQLSDEDQEAIEDYIKNNVK